MSRNCRLRLRILIAGCVLAATGRAQQEVAPADMDLEQLLEVQVEVATGFAQPLSQAPAVASVITAEEIAEMGATDLDEVLETVPGLHVGLSQGRGLDPVYGIRGIQSSTSSQVLILVNGVPVTQLLNGGPLLGFQLPVTAIARVEVIRGPGSAVNGADAFAGVVNVITKTAADVRGTEAGLRAGSFGSRELWLAHGATYGGWDVALTVDWSETDGDDGRVVEEDQQTQLDRAFGTEASLAPGPLDTAHEIVDVHLEAARGPWTARLWGWDKERGLGFGVAPILDPEGSQHSSQWLADVVYSRDEIAPGWDFTQRLSYLFIDQDQSFHIFPPGAVVPVAADGNVTFNPAEIVNLVRFPDGVIGQPGDQESHASLDSVAVHHGFERHRWRLNAGLVFQQLDSHEKKNFGPGVIDGTRLVVDGTLTDVTDTPFVYLRDSERDHWYVSLQDEWSIAADWQLTAGVRYDHYSDVGGTVNPRLALVWSGRELTAKLLYGSAFRAPSFGQLFVINNPAGLGNPDLDPEEVDTIELAFVYRPLSRLRAAANLFHYEIDGLIDLVPDPGATSQTAQNVGNQDGYGLEVELEWEVTGALRLESNYAWQRSEDEGTGARVAEAPGRQLYLGAVWDPRPGWSLYGKLHWIADRRRALDDPRPRLDDYARVDLVLRRRHLFRQRRWDLAVTARNLTGEIGREPSDPGIPNDFPLAGRALFAEIRFHVP
ncbi:MAG TPA: TonB-dependent receptor [Thermoanaerobaculia bacterium]|jgi:iron complex outermembrane receptor protein